MMHMLTHPAVRVHNTTVQFLQQMWTPSSSKHQHSQVLGHLFDYVHLVGRYVSVICDVAKPCCICCYDFSEFPFPLPWPVGVTVCLFQYFWLFLFSFVACKGLSSGSLNFKWKTLIDWFFNKNITDGVYTWVYVCIRTPLYGLFFNSVYGI